MPRSHTARTRASGWCRKELAHALLHEGSTDRALAELEAESTAFVVCRALGLDSGDYSFGYVATWAGGGAEAVAAITTSGRDIQRAASVILEGLGEPDGRAAVPVMLASIAAGVDAA